MTFSNNNQSPEFQLLTHTSDPALKKLTLVFDVRDLLEERDFPLKKAEKAYLRSKSCVITTSDGKVHYVFPGVLELLRILIAKENIGLVFYSDDKRELIADFVNQLLIHAVGKGKYDNFKDDIRIFCEENLIPTKKKQAEILYNKYSLHSGRNTKDMRAISKSDEDLKNTIFITHDRTYVHVEQVKNFLQGRTANINYREFKETRKFHKTELQRFNSICYLAGTLEEAISIFESNGSVTDFLFNLQFKATSEGNFKRDFDSLSKAETYERGAAFLKTSNPYYTRVSKEDYENTLATLRSKNDSIIIPELSHTTVSDAAEPTTEQNQPLANTVAPILITAENEDAFEQEVKDAERQSVELQHDMTCHTQFLIDLFRNEIDSLYKELVNHLSDLLAKRALFISDINTQKRRLQNSKILPSQTQVDALIKLDSMIVEACKRVNALVDKHNKLIATINDSQQNIVNIQAKYTDIVRREMGSYASYCEANTALLKDKTNEEKINLYRNALNKVRHKFNKHTDQQQLDKQFVDIKERIQHLSQDIINITSTFTDKNEQTNLISRKAALVNHLSTESQQNTFLTQVGLFASSIFGGNLLNAGNVLHARQDETSHLLANATDPSLPLGIIALKVNDIDPRPVIVHPSIPDNHSPVKATTILFSHSPPPPEENVLNHSQAKKDNFHM